MTNGEKYKTAQERAEAFRNYCNGDPFDLCSCEQCVECQMEWLDLEADEEKPLPCPFCGLEVVVRNSSVLDEWYAHCPSCGYVSRCDKDKKEAIASHNRVAKKCREGKEC